jgi:hypothetical protein
MEGAQHGVVLFYSMSHALRAEKLFKRTGVPVKLIPVPRQLSSDCGICLRFARADEPRVREILAQKQIEIQGIHPI